MLTDNPGLGDARPLVEQLANDSVLSSSVYIFLMEASSIGSTMAQNFIKHLNDVDRGEVKIRYRICYKSSTKVQNPR